MATVNGCRSDKRDSNEQRTHSIPLAQLEVMMHQIDVNAIYEHLSTTDKPYELCRNVTPDVWEALTTCDDEDWPVHQRYLEFDYINGIVQIIEMPSDVHSDVVWAFHEHFLEASGNRSAIAKHGDGNVRIIGPTGDEPRGELQPDQSYGPFCSHPRVNHWNTFVIEVAVGHPERLYHKASKWVKVPGVRFILCISVSIDLEYFSFKSYHPGNDRPDRVLAAPVAQGVHCRTNGRRAANIQIGTRELLALDRRTRLPAGMPPQIVVSLRKVVHDAYVHYVINA